MSFGLRPYEDGDWDALLSLWIASWSAARPDIDFSARAPWLKDLFARCAGEGATRLVTEDAAGLTGFVLFDAKRQWLEQIALAPRAQGSGAAQALLDAAKAACGERLALDVNADNLRALAFYRAEGFVKKAEGKNPLSGLPTIVLEWKAQPPESCLSRNSTAAGPA